MNQFATFPSLLAVVTVSLQMGQPAIAHAESLCPSSNGQSLDRTIAAVPTTQNCLEAPQAEVGRRSLTVVGQGQVTAPADTALLEFRFSSREAAAAAATEATGLSLEDGRQLTEAALKPTIQAVEAAGVPTRNITLQTGSIQNPKLLVKVNQPTQEGLQRLVLTVDRSLKANSQLFLQSISAGYSVNACEPLARSARRIALQDAQRQIVTLAQDVKVALGELVSVTVLPLSGSATTLSCGSKVGVPASPFSLTADDATPPYNPSDKPEVQVRSQVSVTYGIKP